MLPGLSLLRPYHKAIGGVFCTAAILFAYVPFVVGSARYYLDMRHHCYYPIWPAAVVCSVLVIPLCYFWWRVARGPKSMRPSPGADAAVLITPTRPHHLASSSPQP